MRYSWDSQIDLIKDNKEFADYADFLARLVRPLNQIPGGNIHSRQTLYLKTPAFEDRRLGEFWAHWQHNGKGKKKGETLNYIKLKCRKCVCEIWYTYEISVSGNPINIKFGRAIQMTHCLASNDSNYH